MQLRTLTLLDWDIHLEYNEKVKLCLKDTPSLQRTDFKKKCVKNFFTNQIAGSCLKELFVLKDSGHQ